MTWTGVRDPARRRLPYRPPLDLERLLAFLGARAIPGVEAVREGEYRRVLRMPDGPVVLALAPTSGGDRVSLTVAPGEALRYATRIARRLLDLDADPALIARRLGRDPVLRPLLRARPGVRVPGAADGFELLVRAIVGQQVSVAAARTILGRIATSFGTAVAAGSEELAVEFPGADRLAEARLESLGIPARRAGTIRTVADMVAGGALDLDDGAEAGATIRALLEVDGIGPWTVEYVRMRALHDPDAFPAGDLGLRRAFAALGLDARPRAMAERAEAWQPWRAYAAMLLWTHDG
jgi:AraC family transcriptional regulator of adaptative response / DNA-3-methyladenine glycosylase II